MENFGFDSEGMVRLSRFTFAPRADAGLDTEFRVVASRGMNFNMRAVTVLFAVVLTSFLFAANAAGEGGASVATAPSIPWGQQQFGTIAGGSTSLTASYCRSGSSAASQMPTRYWLLNGATGDHVTIDFEVGPRANVIVMPNGSTDFTLDAPPLFDDQYFINANAGGKHQLAFTLNQGGLYPVLFCQYVDYATAYNFTANVKHAVVLTLKKRKKLSRSGTLNVAVHTPEGLAVSDPALTVAVQIKKPHSRKWKRIGSASVSNSVAAVPYRLSSSLLGKKISIRAVTSGLNYVDSYASKFQAKVK